MPSLFVEDDKAFATACLLITVGGADLAIGTAAGALRGASGPRNFCMGCEAMVETMQWLKPCNGWDWCIAGNGFGLVACSADGGGVGDGGAE